MNIKTKINNNLKKLILAATIFVLVVLPVKVYADENSDAVDKGILYLKSQQEVTGGIAGFAGITDWAAMAFVAANTNPATVENSGMSVVDFISANPPGDAGLATDWERSILALTAASENPYTFGGRDYVDKLLTYFDGTQLGAATQVNDDIFGLLALIAADSDSDAKDAVVAFILANQETDGGFSWSTTETSDIDTTAAAIQALEAAESAGLTHSDLTSSIDEAKAYLLTAKNTDGGFGYTPGETSNASTTAWVVMAMNATGVTGADVDAAKAYIRSAQEENGSFKWQPAFAGETFTTSYAVIALAGEYWPVEVYEEEVPIPTVTPSPSPTPMPTPTLTPTPIVTTAPSATLTPTPIPSPNQGLSISEWRKAKMAEMRAYFKSRRKEIKEELKELRKILKGG